MLLLIFLMLVNDLLSDGLQLPFLIFDLDLLLFDFPLLLFPLSLKQSPFLFEFLDLFI